MSESVTASYEYVDVQPVKFTVTHSHKGNCCGGPIEVLRISPNGDVAIHGEVVGNDPELTRLMGASVGVFLSHKIADQSCHMVVLGQHDGVNDCVVFWRDKMWVRGVETTDKKAVYGALRAGVYEMMRRRGVVADSSSL